MPDVTLRSHLIRLAHSRPDLRATILPLMTHKIAMEFTTQKALDKYLKDHPKADKSKHKVKSESDTGRGGEGKAKGSVYSDKHRVNLRGITESQLDDFYNSPDGQEIKGYNLEVIAGEDGVVDAESLKRAVHVRDQYLAIQKASKKPKSERTQEDDDALDVCKATPACAGNLGVSRSSMPQFLQISPKAARAGIADKRFNELLGREKAGKGLPDDIGGDEREAYYNRKNAEAAIEAGADPDSDVSVFDDWVKDLRKGGVKVTRPKSGMRVGDLKATQSEISADAVLRNADKYLSGKELTGGVIYVSSDNHILDGHHRWAGLLTADPDAKIPVVKIGVPMTELLEKSFQHPGVFRQDFRFEIVPDDAPLDLARKPGSTWQQKNGKWYGKTNDGKSGGPFSDQTAAKKFAVGGKGKTASRYDDYQMRVVSSMRDTMSDNALRGRLIRLAHARPELRPHLLPLVAHKIASRPVYEIAREIRSNWKPVYFGAKPYLEAMFELENVNDRVGADSGAMIIRYFLANAGKWRGDVAKRVKAELNQMVKSKFASEEESDTMGCGEGPVMAKHEKGKSVDPTTDMSPEDAAEWKKQNAIHKDQFTKGASASLRMISDPGHGWLEVPVSELVRLGIAKQISPYSYRKGQMAYLEEDMDAGTYLQALQDAGEPRPNLVEVYQEHTPIRNYPKYR
jgi:hypothetical protein